MDIKRSMLVYSEGNAKEILKSNPQLDRKASMELANTLFPMKRFAPAEDGNLLLNDPQKNRLYIGSYPGITIVSTPTVSIDYPSRLPRSFLNPELGNTIHLFAMHSAVEWFAYAIWKNGTLVRSLSISGAEGKLLEDIGPRQPFEALHWSEGHPLFDDPQKENCSPFNFNPLELGDAAFKEYLGYQIEGYTSHSSPIDPSQIPLVGLQKLPWWKIW